MANSYLTRTPSSTGNNQKFTISCWLKRSGLGSQQIFANAYNAQSDNGYLSARLTTTDNFELTSWQTTWKVSSQKFRDTSAWYHFVIAIDTTLATAGDRIKIYVNGSQMTNFNTNNNPSQNHNFPFNTASFVQDVGANNYGSGRTQFWNGYISHYAQVDGSQLTPTSFGETDSTSGIWKFKSPSGVTWGTNGFHLKFENSGALGTDSSGNTNTFTVNGNLKQAVDTPSNVYATLNPLDKSITGTAPTLSNGNNTYTSSGAGVGNNNAVRGTLGASSGKWYFEAKWVQTATLWGMQDSEASGLGWNSNGYWFPEAGGYGVDNGGSKTINGSTTGSIFTALSANNIIGFAYDLDNGKFYVSVNGTFVTSGDPTSGATGTGAIGDIPTGKFYLPIVGNGDYSNSSITHFNFGNGFFGTTAITSAGSNGNGSLFEYDVPSGYYALNTKNINTYG